MEFNSHGFDTHMQYRYYVSPTPTPTPTNVPHFSDQAMIHVSDPLWNGSSPGTVDMPIGVGFPAPVSLRYQFEPGMLVHVEPFAPVAMPVIQQRGYHRRCIGEYEAVPFRWLPPPSPEMKRMVVLGNSNNASMSGSKRKAPLPPSPPVAGFSGFPSNKSKNILEEWRCALCEISAPCEQSLNEHLRGKKHHAQMEFLKGHNGVENGLGLIKSFVKKPTPEIKNYSIGLGATENAVKKKPSKVKSDVNGSKTVKTKKMFKFWCKVCQTGTHDENVMVEHRKGKRHIKNRRKKAGAKKRTR